MKLQKLVYYSHGWHLGIAGRSLINEQVQAWKYGPVIPALYHEFKEFGNSAISRDAMELRAKTSSKGGSGGFFDFDYYAPDITSDSNGPDADALARSLVQRIWELYGHLSPIQLSRMTHEAGSPWYQVAARFNFDPPSGINIPNELIAQYFKRKLQPQSAATSG